MSVLKEFTMERRKKNCNCAKPWKFYITVKANDLEEAVEIAVKMNRANKDYSYRIKTSD